MSELLMPIIQHVNTKDTVTLTNTPGQEVTTNYIVTYQKCKQECILT